jgi:hypothetical protein
MTAARPAGLKAARQRQLEALDRLMRQRPQQGPFPMPLPLHVLARRRRQRDNRTVANLRRETP